MSWTSLLKDLSGGLSLASSVYNVYSAYTQARASQLRSDAQRAALNSQAVVADNNAQIATWQAADALARGQVAENQVRLAGAQKKSAVVARFGAGNIALDEGSALRVITDQDVVAEIDANTARQNAAKEAWADQQSATDYQNQAKLLRAGVVTPGQSTVNAVVGSGLSQAGTLSKQWYTLNQPSSTAG